MRATEPAGGAGTHYITGDLHLGGRADEPAFRGLQRLCARVREDGAALYCLGDLFDYWVGPRQARLAGFRAVLAELARLAAGCPVHLLHGNRDFAMGREVGGIPGLTLHRGDAEASWAGGKALLTHGDRLLHGDRGYQRLRRVIRSPLVRGGLRRLPLSVSLRLAGALRQTSARAVERKPSAAFEIAYGKVRDLFRQGAYDLIVAGHVHRPGVYHASLAGRPRTFITLGAWGARGWVVRLGPAGDAALERFPGPGQPPPAAALP